MPHTSKGWFSSQRCKCTGTWSEPKTASLSPLLSWPAPTPSLQPEWRPQLRASATPCGATGFLSTHISLGRKGFIYQEQWRRCEVPSTLLRYLPSFLNLLPPSSRPRGPSPSATPKTRIYNQSCCGISEAPHGGRGTETTIVGMLMESGNSPTGASICALERNF